jgi:type IV secretion system protein VirB5
MLHSRLMYGILLIAFLGVGTVRPAQAQFAVIDVAALNQLVTEYQTLQQELSTAQSALSQARTTYAAMIGSRGMQYLLGGMVRNYLPANYSDVLQVMSGSSASFSGLATDVRSLISSNAVLTPAQVAALSLPQQLDLASARQTAALLAATSHSALSNSSDRFASLQQLISAIGTAGDQKASLDLNARIAAEQGMLQNEATKLQVLYQVAQSEEWARVQRAREHAIADQGSLRTLHAMGL